jgi:hypothetical protein
MKNWRAMLCCVRSRRLAAPLGTFRKEYAFAAQPRQNPVGRYEQLVLLHGGSEHAPHALRIIMRDSIPRTRRRLTSMSNA